MASIILILVSYILIGGVGSFLLLKDGRNKEFKIYIGLLLISFITGILLALNVKIPSPAKPIEEIVGIVRGK